MSPQPSSNVQPGVCHAAGQFLRVILPTALALMLCNMDRICMAVAIVPMAAEFGWAPSVQVHHWQRMLMQDQQRPNERLNGMLEAWFAFSA